MEAVKDVSTMYVLTPELTFSPSLARTCGTYHIGSVLPHTESRHIEYKTGGYAINNLDQHIRKYGSAFLNSGGGTLALGVTDNGTVVGIFAPPPIQASIKANIKSEFKAFTPSVKEEYFEIDFIPTNKRNYYVLELHVRAGDETEIYSDKESKMYIRRDGSVQGPLWPRDIKEIVLEKYQKELSKR